MTNSQMKHLWTICTYRKVRLQAFLLRRHLHGLTPTVTSTQSVAGSLKLESTQCSWQDRTTWNVPLWCFKSYNIYSVDRIFQSFSKTNIYLQWLGFSKASKGLGPTAESLQDIRSKILLCLEDVSQSTSPRYIFFLECSPDNTDLALLWISSLAPIYCFSSTNSHCLRDNSSSPILRKNLPSFLFYIAVPSKKKSRTSLCNIPSLSVFKNLLPCTEKPTIPSLSQAPKYHQAESFWNTPGCHWFRFWLQLCVDARFLTSSYSIENS